MTDYEVRQVSGESDLTHAHAVRRAVFIEEQGVAEAIEMDDKDEEAIHVVVSDPEAEMAVGTARLRIPRAGVGKAERVAVRSVYRGEGLGTLLMEWLEEEARDQGCSEMSLHAQTAVKEFYEKLGYIVVSDEFEEAGIPHVEMKKSLD